MHPVQKIICTRPWKYNSIYLTTGKHITVLESSEWHWQTEFVPYAIKWGLVTRSMWTCGIERTSFLVGTQGTVSSCVSTSSLNVIYNKIYRNSSRCKVVLSMELNLICQNNTVTVRIERMRKYWKTSTKCQHVTLKRMEWLRTY